MNIKQEALVFVYNDKMLWYVDREEYSSLDFCIFEQILTKKFSHSITVMTAAPLSVWGAVTSLGDLQMIM